MGGVQVWVRVRPGFFMGGRHLWLLKSQILYQTMRKAQIHASRKLEKAVAGSGVFSGPHEEKPRKASPKSQHALHQKTLGTRKGTPYPNLGQPLP